LEQLESKHSGVTLISKESINKQAILSEAIDVALSTFGSPARNTVLWYLHSKGQYLQDKDFNLREFASVLEELIGSGVDVVLNDVYSYLEDLHITACILEGFDQGSCPNGPIDKIEKLLNGDEAQK
jgi:hypothetical protein